MNKENESEIYCNKNKNTWTKDAPMTWKYNGQFAMS